MHFKAQYFDLELSYFYGRFKYRKFDAYNYKLVVNVNIINVVSSDINP